MRKLKMDAKRPSWFFNSSSQTGHHLENAFQKKKEGKQYHKQMGSSEKEKIEIKRVIF